MNPRLETFIRENIHLQDEEKYEELYDKCELYDRGRLTEFLMSCGIKPDNYMSMIPEYYLYMSDLRSYEVSKTVIKIEGYAFLHSSIESISIPDSVVTIGNCAFRNCSKLTTVMIPDSVKTLGAFAFKGCLALNDITLSKNLTYIGGYAFEQCTSLSSITIPEQVTKISDSTFSNCYRLSNITLNENLTRIQQDAFINCHSLCSINIPKRVYFIGAGAFEGCNKLRKINYDGLISEWESISQGNMAWTNVPVVSVNCVDGPARLRNYND